MGSFWEEIPKWDFDACSEKGTDKSRAVAHLGMSGVGLDRVKQPRCREALGSETFSRTSLAQLLNWVKGPTPASLIEEVNEFMKGGFCLVREGSLVDTGFGGHYRPVDEEGAP